MNLQRLIVILLLALGLTSQAFAQPEAFDLFNRGREQLAKANYQSAIASFEKAAAIRPTLAPVARLFIARAYVGLGDRGRALQILTALSKESLPPNTSRAVTNELQALQPPAEDTVFERGMDLYQNGDYPQAIRLFDESLGKSETSEAMMMKGLAYLRIGEPKRARDALRATLELSPRADLADSARSLLTQIKENLWQRAVPYWVHMDLAGGYNSNYFENGYSEVGKSAALGQTSLGVGYLFGRSDAFSIEPQYFFLWQNAFLVPETDIFTHSFLAPVNYQRGPLFVQFTPAFQTQSIDSQWLLVKPEVGARIQWSLGRMYLGLSYDVANSVLKDPSFAYLAGTTQTRRGYATYSTRKCEASLFYVDWVEDTGDEPYLGGTLPLADHSYGPGAIFTYYMTPALEFDTIAAYYFKNYLNMAWPEGILRKDRQNYFAERITYALRHNVHSYLSWELYVNKSNLTVDDIADKNFTKMISYLGLIWDVFQ